MMRRTVTDGDWHMSLLVVFVLALCRTAIADERPPVPALPIKLQPSDVLITPQEVRPHVEYLASPELQGRGPEGKVAAREYIIQQLSKLHLQPLFHESFLQPLPASVQPGAEPRYVGANIGAYLPAADPECADEWIVINAHYDHLGIRGGVVYPGADDNASSVAMLLETARQLAQSPRRPRRNIAFVAFDLEEQLLWGSRWFVAHPPCPAEQIKFCITADLLGRSLGNLPMRAVFVVGSEHAPQLRSVLETQNPSSGLSLQFLGADMVGTRSDYGPFRDLEIPFLFFSTGEHPDYHTPQDTPDKIDYEKLSEISTLMARLTQYLGEVPQIAPWKTGDPTDIIDAQTMRQVTQVLLQADAAGEFELSGLQRAFVSQLEAKTSYAVRRGRISADERVWLIRSAQFLLISVFKSWI